jgi:hypothetical protein
MIVLSLFLSEFLGAFAKLRTRFVMSVRSQGITAVTERIVMKFDI